MRRGLILLLLLGSMQLILPLGRDVPSSGALLTLGFLILAAYTVGEISGNFGLPKLLGYLIAGILFGPSALGTATAGAVFKLASINELAVALIAFIAGAELKWSDVRRDGPTYSRILAAEMPVTFIAVVAAIFFLSSAIPTLDGASNTRIIVFGMLVGAIAIAHSPAATLGLIKETGAQGPVTHNTLGVVLLSDLVLVIFFTAVVTVARVLLPPGGAIAPPTLGVVLWEIAGALVMGALLGGAVALYMRFIKGELLLIGIIVAMLGVEIAHLAHVELLLTLLTAGFVSENLGGERSDALKHAVERAAAPIFVVFFALSGAAINVAEVASMIGVVVPLVLVRIAALWAGTTFATRRSALPRAVGDRIWLGLVAQMGVAIGLASVVAGIYPDMGPEVRTVALALIAINQLIGPIFFKRALTLSGELPLPDDAHASPPDRLETVAQSIPR